jgi:drug/metabolite transporter (DMT)-like permease
VSLMPYDFTRLVFTGLLAYLFFGETLTSNILLGSAIIVGSTVYIAHREAQLKRRQTASQEIP